MNKIDFVIIWVDGSDENWLSERQRYQTHVKKTSDDSKSRYRDWDNLKYWFRGVETFCPWVNKIHFVTWGHLPEWLDTTNPKLNIVKHTDFIPEKYLPTFSSHVIELNLHRIEGLAEHFVYFNDDMFILKTMSSSDFFVDGKPCDSAILNVHCYDMEKMIVMAPFRDIGIINHAFSMKKVIKDNIFGWFNWKYGVHNLRNAILLTCPRFPGMLQQHLPTSFLKTTFSEVWSKYEEILNETCQNKFRNISDVNQWVFKEWQLASNNFYPRKLGIGRSFVSSQIDSISSYIKNQSAKLICINDLEMSDEEFNYCVELTNNSFNHILPQKSSFEK